MLQKITNIKKLFQRHKPEVHASTATIHSTRCILHVANLSLFGIVVILTIVSALIYYLMPVTDISELSKMIEVQKEEITHDTDSPDVDTKKEEIVESEAFSVIAKRNVFSHDRKEWLVKAVIPKGSELDVKKQDKKEMKKKALAQKKALAGKPKKIVLHGIVMAGGLKKDLINNPLTGVSKKKTLYVEEGEELEGYMVTSIEKDRIKLDWHGEEIVIMLYSGLKDFKLPVNNDKMEAGGLTKSEYKFKTVEDTEIEEDYNNDGLEVINTAYPNVFDKAPISLKSMDFERSDGK